MFRSRVKSCIEFNLSFFNSFSGQINRERVTDFLHMSHGFGREYSFIMVVEERQQKLQDIGRRSNDADARDKRGLKSGLWLEKQLRPVRKIFSYHAQRWLFNSGACIASSRLEGLRVVFIPLAFYTAKNPFELQWLCHKFDQP